MSEPGRSTLLIPACLVCCAVLPFSEWDLARNVGRCTSCRRDSPLPPEWPAFLRAPDTPAPAAFPLDVLREVRRPKRATFPIDAPWSAWLGTAYREHMTATRWRASYVPLIPLRDALTGACGGALIGLWLRSWPVGVTLASCFSLAALLFSLRLAHQLSLDANGLHITHWLGLRRADVPLEELETIGVLGPVPTAASLHRVGNDSLHGVGNDRGALVLRTHSAELAERLRSLVRALRSPSPARMTLRD